MLVAVTYSTKDYEKARKYNVKMAYKMGKVDQVFEYCEEDISEEFKVQNSKTFACKRGGGYWLWKPYVVNKALEQIAENDYLFYCDSGAFLTRDVRPLIAVLEEQQTDILFFELDCLEKEWTKRDIFIALECDITTITDTMQRCATYFLVKKTPKTMTFMKEWLSVAQRYELISDEDNICYHQPNYEGFKENRHDQSIFSVLSKKYGYKAYTDISQYRYPRGWKTRIDAMEKKKEHTTYPIMVCLHRQKRADWTSMFREKILNYFPQWARYLHYGYH